MGVVLAENLALAPACNRFVSGFGDSRIHLSWSGSNGNDFQKGYGIMHWLGAYSLGIAMAPVGLNGGVAGDTTVQMLARIKAHIAAMKAAGSNLVVLFGSTNDRTGGRIDLGTSKRNIREMVRLFQLAGITVILISETPRGNGSSDFELTTQALKNDHYAMHVWMQEEMSKMCEVVNVWDDLVDPSSGTNYYPYPQMLRDGIHPSKVGAQVIGKRLAQVVAKYIRGLADLLESNTLFDASTNPLGSLTANPLMTGATGTVSANANATSGSVMATGWTTSCNNMTGLQTTWSKEVDGEGVEWQKVRIFGASGSTAPEITCLSLVTLSSLSDQDKIKATGLVKSKGVGLSAVGLALYMEPSYTQKLDGEDSDSSLPWPSEEIGPLSRETPVLTYLTSANHSKVAARLIVNIQPSKTVDCTVWFSRLGAVKVLY